MCYRTNWQTQSENNYGSQFNLKNMALKILYPFYRKNMIDSWGGSYESTFQVAKGISQQTDVKIVFSGPGRPNTKAKNYGLSTELLSYNSCNEYSFIPNLIRKIGTGVNIIKYMKKAYMYLFNNNFDIVHSNDPFTSFVWGPPAKLSDTIFVSHIRGEYIPERKVRKIAKLSDTLVFVSKSGYQKYKQVIPKNVESQVIHNPVDINQFHPENLSNLRSELDIHTSTPLIGFVGNLVERKRPLLFVDSAIKYLRENEGHFIMVGEDKDNFTPIITDRLANEGMETNFDILGFRNDIENVMSAIDLLVMTSKEHGEAFPRTPLEAMATGVPVITTDTAGVSEAVIDGQTGIVLDPKSSPEEISSAIGEIFENSDKKEKFSMSSREQVMQNFSTEKISDQYLALYYSITNTFS